MLIDGRRRARRRACWAGRPRHRGSLWAARRVDVEIGTLSKAFGVVGGVIAGKRLIIDYIRQKAGPSSSPARSRRRTLPLAWPLWTCWRRPTRWCSDCGPTLGYFRRASSARLRHRPFAHADCPGDAWGRGGGKAVPPLACSMRGSSRWLSASRPCPGKARLRVMNTAALTRADLDQGLAAFAAVGRTLGVI